MRLDHISYVASHDQISDVVNRIGSQIGTAFVDGGIHPKFGTRNFTAPLKFGQYIEVVAPLDHPAVELTPFGQIVKSKLNEGGGWMSWAIAVDNITIIENKLNRPSIEGIRQKPNGDYLRWKQIGISESILKPEFPFYVQWQNSIHPGISEFPVAEILDLEMNGNKEELTRTLESLQVDIRNFPLKFTDSFKDEAQRGILGVNFLVNNKIIFIN